MKYVAHMTCAFQDEKIQAAVAEGGIKAYAIYWILIEAIAAQIRPESISVELTLTWVQWGAKLLVDVRTARRIAAILQTCGVILLQDNGKSATIKIPNILKYADEYTKKVCKRSGQNPDSTRDKLGTMSRSPALPALPKEKKDLKDLPQSVDKVVPPRKSRAGATGGLLEAPPVAALDPGKFKPKDMVGNMTPEELIASVKTFPKGTH